MLKKTIIVLMSLLLLGGVMTGITFFVDNEESGTTSSSRTSEMKLDEFSNIVIDVIAADIKIQNGEDFSISYQLHNKEKVEQIEIIDGTLHFITEIDTIFGRNWRPRGTRKVVCVTVPNEITLNNLNLSTVDGDIEIDDRVVGSASVNSTSGAIKLTSVTADEVTSEVVSGEIVITKSDMIEATASGKSADISFDGSFENVDIHTVSGDCNLTSDTIKNIKIKNVSGDIKVVTPISGISAESYGKINYCGENQGYHFNLPDDDAMLTLHSSSGKIDIQTKGND